MGVGGKARARCSYKLQIKGAREVIPWAPAVGDRSGDGVSPTGTVKTRPFRHVFSTL
jgi:hypothetical protein